MRKNTLLTAAFLLGLNVVASSASADPIKIQNGSTKAFYCTGCHGYNGMGTRNTSPLAGRNADDLNAILADYKKTNSKLKSKLLSRFSDEALEEIALYFASLAKSERGEASFQRDIAPVLTIRCGSCHNNEDEIAGQTLLNSHASLTSTMPADEESKPLITPGSSIESGIFETLAQQAHIQSPYTRSPLSDDELRVLRKWIDQGAKNN